MFSAQLKFVYLKKNSSCIEYLIQHFLVKIEVASKAIKVVDFFKIPFVSSSLWSETNGKFNISLEKATLQYFTCYFISSIVSLPQAKIMSSE